MSYTRRLKDDFRSGEPTAKLSADWINTVARVLNDLDGVGCHIEKTSYGYGWKIVVDLQDGAVPYRWQGSSAGSGTLQVRIGAWTRNDVTVTLAPDEGKDYLTVGSNGENDYVWARLATDDEDVDPALDPDSVIVEHGAFPDDPRTKNQYWILGKYTGGVWAQWWTGGDMDDLLIVPDTQSNLVPTGQKSLDWVPAPYAQEGETEIYGWHSAPDQGVATCEGSVAGTGNRVGYGFPVEFEADPHVTATHTADRTATTDRAHLLVDFGLGLGLDGTTLSLTAYYRALLQDDGRADFGAATAMTPMTADLSGIAYPGDDHINDLIDTWWDTNAKHTDLDFTPGEAPADTEGNNADHDVRYWARQDKAGCNSYDFWTTGECFAQFLGLVDNEGAPDTDNEWNAAELIALVTEVEIVAETANATLGAAAQDVILDPYRDLKVNSETGQTATLIAVDSADSVSKYWRFHKGVLVEKYVTTTTTTTGA